MGEYGHQYIYRHLEPVQLPLYPDTLIFYVAVIVWNYAGRPPVGHFAWWLLGVFWEKLVKTAWEVGRVLKSAAE